MVLPLSRYISPHFVFGINYLGIIVFFAMEKGLRGIIAPIFSGGGGITWN